MKAANPSKTQERHVQKTINTPTPTIKTRAPFIVKKKPLNNKWWPPPRRRHSLSLSLPGAPPLSLVSIFLVLHHNHGTTVIQSLSGTLKRKRIRKVSLVVVYIFVVWFVYLFVFVLWVVMISSIFIMRVKFSPFSNKTKHGTLTQFSCFFFFIFLSIFSISPSIASTP